MTLHHHDLSTQRNRPGFSLIEIVVVIGITVMMFGVAIFFIGPVNEEKALRQEHGQIEDLVRQGRALAVSYQQTFVLELSEGQAALRPLVLPDEESQYDSRGEEKRASGLQPLEDQEWPRVEELSQEYQMSVRRWGKTDFAPIIEKQKVEILLESGGMFEPIAIRVFKNDGADSLTRVYHPLTGLAEDEEMTITAQK